MFGDSVSVVFFLAFFFFPFFFGCRCCLVAGVFFSGYIAPPSFRFRLFILHGFH